MGCPPHHAWRSCLRFALGGLAAAFLFGGAITRAADEPATGDFHLAAGEASVRLREFAEQSGRQVIFPTELVLGIKTPALDGHLKPREALEQLLAGSELTVWEDPQTGALAIGRAVVADKGRTKAEAPILLPPFMVEDISTGHWRYTKADDLEVLSRASDSVTAGLIAQIRMMRVLLELMLPATLQGRSDLPTSCLIFAGGGTRGVPPELLAQLAERTRVAAAARKAEGDIRAVADLVGVLPNYRFWDHDSHAIFFLWDDLDEARLMPAPDYVRYLLESRTPTLPRWYIEGMVELYRSTIMYTRSMKERVFSGQSALAGTGGGAFEPDTVHLKRLVWMSDAITQRLQQARTRGGGGALATELHLTGTQPLPLAELFAAPSDGHEAANLARRRAQTAALLIRRMLDPNSDHPPLSTEAGPTWRYLGGSAIAALTQLVERAAARPVTERDFHECFGVSLEDADADLMAYFSRALDNGVTLRPGARPLEDPVELSDAQPDDIARIRGGFGRLEVRYVASLYPELAARYLTQARHTLQAAYAAGDRDPRLLAELGLCEVDANNDAGAAPYLDAAVTARVVRPRAYLELARIRLGSLRAGGSGAKLTARETQAVLEPLWLARRQRPALAESYELMGETWLRSSASPDSAQLEALAEGARLFPQRTRLSVLTALVYASQRQWTEAQHHVTRGLQFATDPHDREHLLKLEAAIKQDQSATP
ncbi:MAG TPA: STN domain-containing protein [Opitutaceae bacterium]|nr:STN domain-containing protein [Opitutaceae bacterium]